MRLKQGERHAVLQTVTFLVNAKTLLLSRTTDIGGGTRTTLLSATGAHGRTRIILTVGAPWLGVGPDDRSRRSIPSRRCQPGTMKHDRAHAQMLQVVSGEAAVRQPVAACNSRQFPLNTAKRCRFAFVHYWNATLMMNTDDANLRQLVTGLDRKRQKRRGLTDAERQTLVHELELCLVDPFRLERYLEVLRAAGHDQRCQNEGDGFLDDDEQFSAVLKRGLVALDDATLIQFALNPFIVAAMANLIGDELFVCNERASAYWDGLMRKLGRELLDEDRRKRASREAKGRHWARL